MSANLAEDLSALLRSRGWSIASQSSSGTRLWSLEGRTEMYLPPIVVRGSFLWSDITRRIVDAHGEHAEAVEQAVDLVRFDITRFGVGSIDDARSVRLDAGAAVLNSAFSMLRAAATAARRPRQSIGSNYSPLGDEIMREARLAHTEVGSFVFPVALKVSDPAQEDEPLSGDDFGWGRPESPERRVTRTLAQAMASFERHVLRPAREPRLTDLMPVVIAGGTKEMLGHVGRVISEPGVSFLETRFSWAPIEAAAAESPTSVTIPAEAEARDIIAKSVQLLSTSKRDPLRIITGPIIHISHTPDDPFGEIAIQAPIPNSSRLGRVEVRVRRENLSQIHHWMDQGTTVVVQGVVERRPGRPARLKEVASPQALEDAFLTEHPASDEAEATTARLESPAE